MPRTARAALGGIVYHVLNRGNGRMRIFRKPGDYQAFMQLLVEGKDQARIDLFSFCLMPNHWHLVLRPHGDDDLAAYLSWVTNTHVKRYRTHYPNTSGHLYQGRYKSFAVEEEGYFLTLSRYVEANALRAEKVQRAQEWRWSSLGCDAKFAGKLLSPWPLDRPGNWATLVNEDVRPTDRLRLQASFQRGRPLGNDSWIAEMAERMGLHHTLNPRGRPAKATKKSKNRKSATEKVDVTFTVSEAAAEPPSFD